MTAVVRKKGNQFNLAAQSARQAGSTFKTFVLASAIEQGIDPDTTYYTSAPFTCTVGPWCSTITPWDVHTYENTYAGSESITRATLASDNTVYAQLTLDVGPRYVWNMAHRLGVHMSPDKPVASIGLGSLVGLAARHGGRVRDVPGDGHLREADGDHEGRPRRTARSTRRWLGKPQTKRARLRRRRVEGEPTCCAERALRHGRRLGRRHASERGQDRHDREPRRRVVRRLHAPARDGRLDGLPKRRDPDARRARRRRSQGATFPCRSGTSTWPPRCGTDRCEASRCPKHYPT